MSAVKRYLEDKAAELSDLYNIDEAIFMDVLPQLPDFMGNEDKFRFAWCENHIIYVEVIEQIDGEYDVFTAPDADPEDSYPCLVAWKEE